MINAINDLAVLTTIPKETLNKLCAKIPLIISNAIYENNKNREAITSVNLGIGILHIAEENDLIKYKFEPSQDLEECVRSSYTDQKNLLTIELEKTLASRIVNTYKDFM